MRKPVRLTYSIRTIVTIVVLIGFSFVSFSSLRPIDALGNRELRQETHDVSNGGVPDLGAGASLNGARPFPVNNPWNQDVSRVPLHPNSTNLIASIGSNGHVHPDFGTVYAGAPNGIPYVVVSGTQPRVPIAFTAYGNQSDPGPYPVPTNAPIEGGPTSTGDRHVIVIDRDDWKLYEMFYSFPLNGGASWQAASGAIFDFDSNAVRPEGWTSADAAGLPIFPGLVRYDEVYGQQEIKHALRFTAQQTRRAYIYPARHFASDITNINVPAMGTRVRLRANFPVAGFSPAMRVILTALKKYGMILADNGSNWYISGSPDMRWSDDELHTLDVIKGSDFEVVQTPNHLLMPHHDFDGDARTDISVFRPGTGNWFIQSSSDGAVQGHTFGISTDKPTPGDFDGDGITDISVFRDGFWFSLRSSDGSFYAKQFGSSGDVPVPADFDGDGKTDLAVFRQGNWYVLQSSNGLLRANGFGLSTDSAEPSDYDGDGKTDLAVFRPSSGTWYILQSFNGSLRAQQFGMSGDTPVAGDYDADGKADVAVFRPASGTWYVYESLSGTLRIQPFGVSSDRPVPGDYDGDWKWDFAVFRPSEGGWYILNSYDGTIRSQQFGANGDVPLPGSSFP
jgi:hypothetical protein